MTARSFRGLALISLGAFVLLLVSHSSRTQATTPTTSSYLYKVELVKNKGDLQGRLQEDGRNGWRVQGFAASPADNEFVMILEKASTP